MEKQDLSSKIILILSNEFNLSLSLKNELQKEVGVVDIISNPHQAIVYTILKEPDIIFIEINPDNLSGLQLLEEMKKVNGIKKNPRILIFTEKNFEAYFRQKTKEILFLDFQEISQINQHLKNLLEGTSSLVTQSAVPWIHYRDKEEVRPVFRKELDILEKLGQMGILKKK